MFFLFFKEVKLKFFIDTADVSEIKDLSSSGFLDGVTTNPSLIKKAGRNINEVIAEHKYELPNFDVVIPTSGIIFDLPMAFLELIYQIEDSRQYYLLRHFFNFLFFHIKQIS